MMYWLRNIVAYLICAVAAEASSQWIASTMVADLLIPNLTTIVIALLAINVQTTAVIAVKLREIADRAKTKFGGTVQQFRLAIFEQAVLVIASLALSAVARSMLGSSVTLFINIGVFFVLFASLHIFLDTTVSLLIALFPEDDPAS